MVMKEGEAGLCVMSKFTTQPCSEADPVCYQTDLGLTLLSDVQLSLP